MLAQRRRRISVKPKGADAIHAIHPFPPAWPTVAIRSEMTPRAANKCQSRSVEEAQKCARDTYGPLPAANSH